MISPISPFHLRARDLSGLAANDLSPRRADRVRRHLASCASCRAEWEAIQMLFRTAQTARFDAAPPELRERIFAAHPLSVPLERTIMPVPVFVRPVFGATVAAASVVTVLSLGALYGPALVLRAPRAVAFSVVESAMASIKTVEWTETRTQPKASGNGFKITDANDVWVRLNTPAMVVKSAAYAHKPGGHRFLHTERGTLSFTPGGRDYFLMDGSLNHQKNAAALKRRIVEAIIFPHTTTAQNAVQTDGWGADAPFKWRSSPWKIETVQMKNKPTLRFSRHSVRFRDDDPWWKKQTKQEYNLTIFADPQTYRIVRREWEQTAGAGGPSRTVSDDFHYNEMPPEDTFAAVPPPVGTPVIFTDWTETGTKAKVPDEKRKIALDLINRLTQARSKNDWAAFSALRDFSYEPLHHQIFWETETPTAKEKAQYAADPRRSEAAYRAAVEKGFKSGASYTSWRVDKIVSVGYGFDYLYTRKSEAEPFPPMTKPTSFEVRAHVTPSVKNNKTAPQQFTTFTIVETSAGLRIAGIRFDGSPRPPLTGGLSPREFGMRAVIGGYTAPKKAAKRK